MFHSCTMYYLHCYLFIYYSFTITKENTFIRYWAIYLFDSLSGQFTTLSTLKTRLDFVTCTCLPPCPTIDLSPPRGALNPKEVGCIYFLHYPNVKNKKHKLIPNNFLVLSNCYELLFNSNNV